MIEAAIDIGTNTMLLLTAEIETDKSQSRRMGKVLDDQIRFVRLGQGVHQNRKFLPEAMERALKCFHEFKERCDMHRVKVVHASATSASRDSANAKEFYGRVREETGIDVKIIPGETEAHLSFIGGMLPFQKPEEVALLDIGGGSTEFVTLHQRQSVNMGCVRATEMFLKGDPYDRKSVEEMEKHLKNVWSEIDPKLQTELREKDWTGIAGTPTTIAALELKLFEFNGSKVDGYRMSRCDVGDWFEALALQTQKQRSMHPIMGAGRADIIVAGIGILLTAMEYFDKEDVLVSSRGLRHGILLEPPNEEKKD